MLGFSFQNAVFVLAEGRSGLQWLLYGHLTVPYWIVALLVGLAVTTGMVYLLRRLAD